MCIPSKSLIPVVLCTVRRGAASSPKFPTVSCAHLKGPADVLLSLQMQSVLDISIPVHIQDRTVSLYTIEYIVKPI